MSIAAWWIKKYQRECTISHQVIYRTWCRVLGSTSPTHKSSPCLALSWIDTRPTLCRNFWHPHFGDSTGELSCNLPSFHHFEADPQYLGAITMLPKKSTRQNSVANSHVEVESQGHSHAMGETHAQGGGQTLGGENPLDGGQALGSRQVLGGREIPVGGPQQMALMLEMIKGMQQNQIELAKSLRQLREANGNKEDHQNKNDNRNHEERESHNKNDTPFVTLSDVADLLKQERERPPKEPRHFVRRPPYPIELLKEPYPEKYDTLVFALAYTWYTVLPDGSIRTWEDMVESFCSKYFHVKEKITLVNLHGTKQQIGEDLVKYIHRFRDVSLDCHVKYQEGELVEVCIDNTLPEFHAHLENLGITRFAPLLQKARKTAISVKPQVEKGRDKKSLSQTLTVSIATTPSNTKQKNPTEKVYEEPPPLPFTAEEMMAIFDKWVQDQVIKLPKTSKQPTAEEQKDPKYCRYHRYVHHPTVDCRTLRWEINRKIQDGTLQLSEEKQKVHKIPFPNYNKGKGKAVVSVVIHRNVSDMEAEEFAAASSFLIPAAVRTLQKSPKFKSLFNQLGFGPEARNAATEALITIAAESGATCFTAEAHASCAFLETTNAITFTDEDMEVQYPDHRRPLYLSAVVKDVQVRCALVDTGSCLNLIPLSTLQAANVPQQKIQGSPMEVTGFGGVTEYTMGHVQLVLRVGPIVALTRFHVVNAEAPYHGRLNGKPIRIAANSCPFDQTEAHFVEAALYDDLASTGEPSIVRPCGTPLPAWEDIKDDPEIDLWELLERKKKRKEREVEHGSPPQCVLDQIESTAMSSEEAMVDQIEFTVMKEKKSTTAEPNVTAKEELEVINLSADPNVSKPISISMSLSIEERKCLIDLLHEYKDVFTWDYDETPRIDPGLVAHSLNVEPGTRPVVQPRRTFHTEVEAQITQEVKKLLAAGFIKPIQHPRWLSNIVPVKKKNGQIRCCVDFRNLNKACPKDEFPLPNMDLLEVGDWRTPFLEYLIENILPQTNQAAVRLKKLATRYFVEGGILFRKGFCGDPLRCLSLAESQIMMKEAHSGECEEHQGKKRLYQLLLTLGYYWPTMNKDTADFVKSCHTCQLQANLIYTHPTSLQNMATLWPFHTWGLDLIGPINPSSGRYIWILVATKYFSKWVEVIPLRKTTGAAVTNFICEHIITRFGIPHKIISDNGTPFVNKNVREVLEHYQIKHRRSTPYYPQGNGQAEATNRMLLRILSKMVFDYGKGWSSHLADTLWAYRGSTKTATGFTPFSLVYGTDAISPTELLVSKPRILHGMDLKADADICAEARVADLESLEEARELAQVCSLRYHQKLVDAYEKTLQTRTFVKGQMVLRIVDHVRRGLPSPSKFAPNWEGPYLIREAYDSGYYKLSTANGTTLVDPINEKWLKRYYS
uniref:Integrase catalytic domain-containing protein n=1 Tax=Fagus sylvatica TaxID=28930 RepID=A0A2N9G273_FAGSY